MDPLLSLMFFPYGVVKVTCLETNKVLKVKGHHLKPFYEAFIAYVELAEQIYEE